MRAGLVPRDDSPLVAWHRVVAVSRGGSILVMGGLPAATLLGIAELAFVTPKPSIYGRGVASAAGSGRPSK